MTLSGSAELARLREANPEPIDATCVRGAGVQATLARILSEPVEHPASRIRFRGGRLGGSSRRLVVMFAVLIFGGAAAFAATDPPGWWSSSPTEARYGSNPATHALAPTARIISCARPGVVLRCSTGRPGQRYTRLDTVRAPQTVTRHHALATIASLQGDGRLSAAHAARLRADIAAVPDSFFAEYSLATRYATYTTGSPDTKGRTLVPPPGTPAFLACERVRTGLSCQNLNGDEHVPVGAGIYGAVPASDWRLVRLGPSRYGQLPPGISFTRAEIRLLVDLGRFASSSGHRAPPKTSSRTR